MPWLLHKVLRVPDFHRFAAVIRQHLAGLKIMSYTFSAQGETSHEFAVPEDCSFTGLGILTWHQTTSLKWALQAECTAAHHAKQQEEARVIEARRLMGGLRGQREAEATHLEQLQAEQLQMRAQAQQLVDQKHDARRYAQLQQSR